MNTLSSKISPATALWLIQYVELLQADGHLDKPGVCLLKAAYFFGPSPVETRATGYDGAIISTVM